jgi:flagellar motor switch protein FliM
VRCGPVALFEGRMGQKNNSVAVKIERELVRPQQSDRF